MTHKNMSDIRIYKKKKKKTPGASSSTCTLKEGQIDIETKREEIMTRMTIQTISG